MGSNAIVIRVNGTYNGSRFIVDHGEPLPFPPSDTPDSERIDGFSLWSRVNDGKHGWIDHHLGWSEKLADIEAMRSAVLHAIELETSQAS